MTDDFKKMIERINAGPFERGGYVRMPVENWVAIYRELEELTLKLDAARIDLAAVEELLAAGQRP